MYTRFFLQLNQFPKLIMLAALLISFFFFDQVRQKLFDQSRVFFLSEVIH